MIIPNDYVIPAPEPGERPVSVKKASQLTGYSTSVINRRVRRGILPSFMPISCERGRMVYVSQLLYVMEGVSEGAA